MTTIDMNIHGKRVQAVMLKAHCKMMAIGMTHSKMSKTKVLALAGAITGKKYKRGQHAIAADDLALWLKENDI